MLSLKTVYLIGIAIITVIIVISCVANERDYNKEIDKIRMLEEKRRKQEFDIEQKRKLTTPCPTPNLTNPKSCYLDSDYMCSWNELANRCDQKKSQFRFK